ncbi:MAG TPA: transglycosylase domain-containing protein [Gaiellaceae bacterium]|nr:transglycosylase domain-containing protein [Gaiellaceae bacterium]
MAHRGRRSRQRRDDELLVLLAARRLGRERKSGGGSAVRVVVIALLLLGFATLVGAAVAAGKAVQAALADCSLDGRVERPLPTTSVVYARNGYYLGAIPAPLHRQPVVYDAMSPWIRKATVAAEDRTFWKNDGLDFASIARAALADLSAGHAVQGASTITQQLIRNLYLNDDKTFARKRLEACLALKLTKEWTKPEILTTYLNRIPYGHHALGIEAAARTYYGIPASRLGPAQAAFLAGLPQAPTAYDPFADRAAALARRNEVLHAMRKDGDLSRSDYRRLLRRPLGLHPGHGYRVVRMPNFFSYVESQLVRAYGREEVRGGGLRVYTTVDPRAQRIALNTMRNTLGRPGDPASALVSLDPRDGAIRALASSWQGHELQFDLPADGARQTGSAFKTFVLTDAVWLHHADPRKTWYDSSKFTYQPTRLSKPWTPRTYEGRYFGPETLFKATLLSDNVVYAKLTLDLGPSSVAYVAHTMGITSPLQAVPSIGLGSNSVTPLTLASAYTTLASGGVHHPPYAIRKVVLPDGSVDQSHSWGPQAADAVLPAGVASVVTKVLEANVRRGTGVAAQIPGRHVAGKTGTTTNWTDAWFAGYTPRLTTVTWVGYPLRTRSMADVHGIQVQGGSFPAQIWHDYSVRVLGHVRPASFLQAAWPMEPYHGPRSMRHRP